MTTPCVLVRYRRLCSRSSCWRKIVSRRLTGEHGIVINSTKNWQEGPALPGPHQYDLQTVLIHEMGHFVGNDHARGGHCQNNPMIRAMGAGDYWRSSTDWHLGGCAMRLQTEGAGTRVPAPLSLHVDVRPAQRWVCVNCRAAARDGAPPASSA